MMEGILISQAMAFRPLLQESWLTPALVYSLMLARVVDTHPPFTKKPGEKGGRTLPFSCNQMVVIHFGIE